MKSYMVSFSRKNSLQFFELCDPHCSSLDSFFTDYRVALIAVLDLSSTSIMCGATSETGTLNNSEENMGTSFSSFNTLDSLCNSVRVSLKPEKNCVIHHQLRLHALKKFTSVLSTKGIKVMKHHRHKSGSALRTLTYDKSQGAIAWDSRKLFGSQRFIPIHDMLDVERDGKLVWIKTLHMGEFGLETPIEEDAEVIYAALDVLMDARNDKDIEPFEGLKLKIDALRLMSNE